VRACDGVRHDVDIAGEITRVLEAGTYYIVFDNRDESTASVALDANFEIQ